MTCHLSRWLRPQTGTQPSRRSPEVIIPTGSGPLGHRRTLSTAQIRIQSLGEGARGRGVQASNPPGSRKSAERLHAPSSHFPSSPLSPPFPPPHSRLEFRKSPRARRGVLQAVPLPSSAFSIILIDSRGHPLSTAESYACDRGWYSYY